MPVCAAPEQLGGHVFFYVVLPSVDATPPGLPLSLKLSSAVPLEKLADRIQSAIPEAVSQWELYWNGEKVDLTLFPSEAGMVPGRGNLVYLQVHYLRVNRGDGDERAALQTELHEALCHLGILRSRVDAHVEQAVQHEAARCDLQHRLEEAQRPLADVDALIQKYTALAL
eukprot:TRINITY_DN5054_c0_g1_i4.p1 TRINITY_DN5054_c0_g1~~TRINITY_DN5054_c0_g1_i4.p1  ORF type:complete len:170 (+),score=20.46 TRINITY_DN5054_c0_g1_i4:138-647(+)